jgi:hypothetical protein
MKYADQAVPLLNVYSLELLHAYPSRSRIDLINVTMTWNRIEHRCGKCVKEPSAFSGVKT